jgi:hypothetical protein
VDVGQKKLSSKMILWVEQLNTSKLKEI